MCGIIGQVSTGPAIDKEVFTTMRDTLHHRGPDDAGNHFSEDGRIALGHRRLSFIDLGAGGHQPMASSCETAWVSFNGEIYNYTELREELIALGYNFHTHSDTEVIVAGYKLWGKQVVNRLKGMFAFAIWDEAAGKLLLVRDRFGIKPLYYWNNGEQFIFASELKAILASGLYERQVDMSSFADYFVYRYIPSPKTIWKGINKLPPAHWLEVDTQTLQTTTERYWHPTITSQKRELADMVRDIDQKLLRSVEVHRRADVPVGSFLSGGYDSSALVYYLTRLGHKPNTFSIGFDNWDNSEHRHADVVAQHLGVEHDTTIASEKDLDLLQIMPQVYDEPIADISIIPTYMVSRLARTKVKAVFSGEGADELFGGYTWQREYFQLLHPEKLSEKLKLWFNKPPLVPFYANAMAMGRFDEEQLQALLPQQYHQHINASADWFYAQHAEGQPAKLKSIQYMDMKCFMAELVLTKVDRASMANSLEVRVPFLDHELFEYILSTDEESYFDPNTTKLLLNQNIKEHLPETIMERRKQGFVGPDSYYMNIAWYGQQLADSELVKAGMINQNYLDKLLQNEDHWRLWKVLVMENWFKHWMCPHPDADNGYKA